ncbi:MAG: nucleoside deaminase [Pseudobdellovibrionaceae bacterium]
MNTLFMKKAIELSRQHMNAGHGGPFGAVIVKDNQIIAEGWNQVTSIHDPTAHAEVNAIRQACKNLQTHDLSGCEIYTSCEPCPMCLAAIYWAHLDKIYFANTRGDAATIKFDDDFLYEEIGKDISQRRIPAIQLLREEALDVFNEWQRKTDKIPY